MVGQLEKAGISSWKPPRQCLAVPWHQAALKNLESQRGEENVEANKEGPHFEDDDVSVPLEMPADNSDTEESGRWKTFADYINEEEEEEEEIMVLGVTKATSSRKPPLSAIARLKAKAAEFEKKEKQNEPSFCINID